MKSVDTKFFHEPIWGQKSAPTHLAWVDSDGWNETYKFIHHVGSGQTRFESQPIMLRNTTAQSVKIGRVL